MTAKFRKSLVMLLAFTLIATGFTFPFSPHTGAVGWSEKVALKDVALDAAGAINGSAQNRTAGPFSGTLIAALYNEGNMMIDAQIQPLQWAAAGDTLPFKVQFGKAIDPNKHTIKVFVWDSFQTKRPLSYVTNVSPYPMSQVTAPQINPYSFFVGRVAREFSETDSKAIAVDLSQYIDTNGKRIKSITNEVDWDYGKGVLRVDTPKSQGATGVLNAVEKIDLTNVAIRSGNAFGTVVVVSLDNLPIAQSKKLLVQAVTEDKSYGYTTETVMHNNVEKLKITNLGIGPMNVKKIDASLILKGITDVKKIYTLDPNMYVTGELQATAVEGGTQFNLNPDSLYTIIEREGLANPYTPVPYTPEPAVYVWWEGEAAVETQNWPTDDVHDDHAAYTFPETRHLLSGQDWLSISEATFNEDNAPYAKYEINVPEDGTYSFYARKFWQHGPYYWRFDGGEWHHIGRNISLIDDVGFRRFLGANWTPNGEVELTRGNHTFEIKLQKEAGASHAAFDCFLLTKQPFIPSALLKPGEKLNRAEEGYFAFEPDTDPFKNTALMDLSYLNEDVAGQSGYIRRQDDKLLFGNGKEARFWAINVGTNAITLGKSDIRYFAKQLAKRGVNMVRIHGIIFDENGEINDTSLDQYQYFVHAMKQEGIYVNLSYYFVLWWNMTEARDFKQPGYEFFDWNKEPFGLIFFNKKQQELYKKGVRKLLNTPNPYEKGLPLGKDPAVGIIETQNEDSVYFYTFDDWKFPENIRKELEKLYGDWLIKKYGSLDAAYTAWGKLTQAWNDQPEKGLMEVEGAARIAWANANSADGKRKLDALQFLTETQRKFYEEMNRFFKKEIGTRSIITASNWITARPEKQEALERYTYDAVDMVDRHAYFESSHESVNNSGWTIQVGDMYRPASAVQHPDLNPVKMVHNDKKPSMISETTWTNPTPFGAEGPFMFAVFASLQGIDVLDLFATAGPSWSKRWDKWPVMSPTALGQYPAFALMYRRGDVTEAKNVVYEVHSMNSLYQMQDSKIYEGLNLDDMRK